MKVVVKKPFRDIHSKKIYGNKAGKNIIEMSKKRFEEAEKNLEKYGGGFIELYTEISDNPSESED